MTKEELVAKINAVAPLIITLLAGLNVLLSLLGLPNLEIGDQTITLLVSGIATVGGEVWSWWRNNNWTKKSQISQSVLNGLKDGTVTTREVEKLVQKDESDLEQ